MVIVEDAACISCSYNLCGLTSDKSCPECGLAVATLVHGLALRARSARSLLIIRNGVTWLRASIGASIVSMMIGLVAVQLPQGSVLMRWVCALLLAVPAIVVPSMFLIAVYPITVSELLIGRYRCVLDGVIDEGGGLDRADR